MDAIWKIDDRAPEQYPPLTDDTTVDVVIIGAGITGLTAALELTEAGLKVMVVEARRVGYGATGGSTGNLYSIVAGGLAPLRKKWNDDVLRDVVRARAGAIDYIEEVVNRFGIDCQFHRRPLHRVVTTDDQASITMLDSEHEAMQAAGLEVQVIETSPLPFGISKGLRIENQAQFNALTYTQELARAVTQLGTVVHENSPVRSVDKKQGVLHTDQARVTAAHIVHATHTPKGISMVQAEMIASREYGLSARLDQGEYPEGIFFVHDPFHSIRSYSHEGEQYLIVIGEKHKTGDGKQEEHCAGRLRAYTEANFSVKSFDHEWSNQQYSPADSLPYIGHMPGQDNAYLATGFSGDGLVWGTLAATMISDMVQQREQPWYRHLSPKRFTPAKSAAKWLEENATVTSSLVRGYLGTDKLKQFDDIPRGQGKVVSLEGDKLAIYRDEDGQLTMLSAVCPHMKCLVHWNGAELSWDCPCHGSRFDIRGEVIEGPSCHALAQHKQSPSH